VLQHQDILRILFEGWVALQASLLPHHACCAPLRLCVHPAASMKRCRHICVNAGYCHERSCPAGWQCNSCVPLAQTCQRARAAAEHSCTCTTTATADVEHILLPRFVWPCRYDLPAIALNCGSMYRDCIRDESLAR
jgi:hypothetical protein